MVRKATEDKHNYNLINNLSRKFYLLESNNLKSFGYIFLIVGMDDRMFDKVFFLLLKAFLYSFGFSTSILSRVQQIKAYLWISLASESLSRLVFNSVCIIEWLQLSL